MRNRKESASDEARAKRVSNELKVWRRQLLYNKEIAAQAMQRAAGLLREQGLHPHDLRRYLAQMRNGVACPGDFGVNDENGLNKRA